MKKIVVIALLFALCINFVIPQTAIADDNSANWGPALLAVGILSAVIAIVWIVSSGSESPKKAENLYKNGQNATTTNIGIDTYAGTLSPYSSKSRPVSLYAFKVEF